MNYPMKNGRIDPEFVEKVFERVNVKWSMAQSEVNAVLLAAQKVMQESSSDEFYPGQKVKDETGREGEIILHPSKTHIWAQFGSTKVMLNKNKLTKIEEAQHGEG